MSKAVYSPAAIHEVSVLAMPPGPRCNGCGEMMHYSSPRCECGAYHNLIEWYDWFLACEEVRMNFIASTNECLIETVVGEGPFRQMGMN